MIRTIEKRVAGWFAALCLLIFASPVISRAISVDQMTVNGRTDPLGISTNAISFSWTLASDERSVVQSAYRIRVGTSEGGSNIWASAWVPSDRQVDISLPAGITLSSATRYYWQVNVKDSEGVECGWGPSAWFETGLLSENDWSGAEWITRAIDSPDPADWTDYNATVEFTLENSAFGVFIRSSADAQNAYMMQVNVADYSYPVFKPHIRTNGGYTLLDTIDLSPFGFSNASLTGTNNTLAFSVAGSTIVTKLNGITIDTRSGISYPNGLVGFRTDGAEAGSVHHVEVVDTASSATLINPDFSSGENGFSAGILSGGSLHVSGNTDAIYANRPTSLPLLRGNITIGNGIASARLYASAQGLYEVSINGQKVGDQFLAPGWTDYGQRIQAQTYDITDLLSTGTNVIGAALGDGWYRGSAGISWTRVYGDQIAFVGRIKVTYTNGTSEWFATDLGWKAFDGPVVQGDLQDGERYNANLEQPGWNTVGFDDSQWMAVGSVPNVSDRLVPQPDEPIRQIEELTAISRTEILPGKWIYDLGQNMVGVPKVVLSGTAGQTITLRHGEEIYRTGAMTGQLYADNLRGADATDSYTFAGNGIVTYQPTFTQHGFRFIEITGTTNPPAVADVHGVVLSSDLPGHGDLETSSGMLNQLVSNIRWGQRSNFLSIPTDTPARDERLGWTGDINVFAPAAARYKDTRAFMTKWMTDVRDTQFADGNIPAIVPRGTGYFDETGVGWSDAVITIPYSVWQATGDEKIIRESWDVMTNFYRFVHDSATGDGDLLEQGRSSWFSGDWLSLESGWNRLEEHKVIATAYFAEDTRMMAEMAEAVGEDAKAAEWAALVPQIRAAFVAAYRNADGTIYQGTQTAYAMALGLDMIADPDQREQTANRFVATLATDNYHLQTGFLGTPWLLPALSKIGRDDLAVRLLLNDEYPSWGFPITVGATTMWERWNSIQPDLSFGPVDMNSFNHYAYGAVGDWMFGNVGGIQALEPGYKASRIAPLIGYGGLTHAACSQETAYGLLASEWDVTGTGTVLSVRIPVNTTAEIVVPASADATVYEGGIPTDSATGVQFLRTENGAKVYSVGSGSYIFRWVPVPKTAPGHKQIMSWNYNYNSHAYGTQSTDVAGVGSYTASYWNDTWLDGRYTDLLDDSGMAASIDIAEHSPGWGGWSIGGHPGTDADGSYNREVINGYLNGTTSAGGSGVTLTQIGYSSYDIAVFFSSDVAGRTGSVTDGATVYYFNTLGVASINDASDNALMVQATDTTTAGYAVAANYAVFHGLSGDTRTITVNIDDGGGLAALQLVANYDPPTAPTGIAADSADAQVSLSWNAISNASSYAVKRAPVSGGPYTVVAGPATAQAVDIGLTNGITYYYVVSALGIGGESGDSAEVDAVPSVAVVPEEYHIAGQAITGGTNISLTVSNSVAGHRYGVLASDSLIPALWTNILAESGNGSNLLFEIPLSAEASNHFFKLDVHRL